MKEILDHTQQARFVYDASDVIKYVRGELRELLMFDGDEYVEKLLVYLFALAGHRTYVLDMPSILSETHSFEHMDITKIEELLQSLEKVIYRMLLPMCYAPEVGGVLKPDELIITNGGEVWLCWNKLN